MSVPADRSLDESTAELVQMLGHPDPRMREDVAFPLLARWIHQGIYDELLAGLGDGLTAGLLEGLGIDGEMSALRRSYSALLLAEIIGRDNAVRILDRHRVLSWGDQITGWYVRECDLRGWIPGVGWSNTIAHGADAIAALAQSHHFGDVELTVLLDVIADRLLKPTSYVWRHGAEDRLAYAVMTVLHRNTLSFELVDAWLARLGEGTRQPPVRGHVDSEWPTPTAHNTSMFLRALQLQLALDVQGRADGDRDASLFAERPIGRADLVLAVIKQIRAESPWLFRPAPV